VPFTLFKHASLTRKIMSVTTVIVMGSCLALSWFFIDREIRSMAEELLKTGRLVALNIAAHSRDAVLAGDQERLAQLIEGTLTSPRADYVLIVSSDGRVLSANGKGLWQEYLADPAHTNQLLSKSFLPESHAGPVSLLPGEAAILELRDGTMQVSDHQSHGLMCWSRLLTGSPHPFVFHLTEPIQNPPESPAIDPALSLTLSESAGHAFAAPAVRQPFSGYVLLGWSSAQDHLTLQKVALQVVLITVLVIALSMATMMYLTRQLTIPLQALTAQASRIAHGDLSTTATPVSHDEIGHLTTAFNQMTTALKTREDDLTELNRTLESRVSTRTEELQRANHQLLELDRLKTILVSNASHELRTPLTSIKIHVKNLLDGVTGALGTDQLQALGRAHENIERLRTLIDDLLDLSRLQAVGVELTREEVQLDKLLRDIVEGLRYFSEQKQLAVDMAFPGQLQPISGDRDKLRRALTNVIHNAMKFTPAGGHIQIDAHHLTDGSVVVTVEDSGYGIAPEELDKVFLPFFRSPHTSTTTRGSGLGLSIAKELIELHHGAIWAESPAGQGSRFFIRLPRAPQDAPAVIRDTL